MRATGAEIVPCASAELFAFERRLQVLGVVDGDAEAESRQLNRDAAPDSPRSAGDESNLWIHGHDRYRFNGKNGIRSSCSPPVHSPAGSAFRAANLTSKPHKTWFFVPVSAFILRFFASITSSF
jgi:hypothetical protein